MSSRSLKDVPINRFKPNARPILLIPVILTLLLFVVTAPRLAFWLIAKGVASDWCIIPLLGAPTIWAWVRYVSLLRKYRSELRDNPSMRPPVALRVFDTVVHLLVLIHLTYFAGLSIYDYAPLQAYQEVLDHQRNPNITWKNSHAFIYMSYFLGGNTEYANQCGIYYDAINNSFFLQKQRVLFSYAVQGGGQMGVEEQQIQQFEKLRNAPPFPEGLPGPSSTVPGRLLMVSQRCSGAWKTYYYDRGNLPPDIKAVLDATSDDRPANAASMGWAPAEWPPPKV